MNHLDSFHSNMWLLPPPFSIDNLKRLEKLIETLKKINPDIIALQEVWLTMYVEILRRELPNYSFKANPSLSFKAFNKGGLVTGTKGSLSVTSYTFVPTPEYSLVEKMGGKGYHLVTLPGNLNFINTHLYAATKTTENHLTQTQFDFVSEKIGNGRGILAGDLNIEQHDFLKINSLFEYLPSTEYTLSNTNKYANTRWNVTPKSKKIDYILGKNVQVTEEILPEVFSDHFALRGTIKY